MISNCSLVMSLGYDFLFFYFRFSSVTAPVLDNEKILHRILEMFIRQIKKKRHSALDRVQMEITYFEIYFLTP